MKSSLKKSFIFLLLVLTFNYEAYAFNKFTKDELNINKISTSTCSNTPQCNEDSDCNTQEICISNNCKKPHQCSNSEQCSDGKQCIEGYCLDYCLDN